MAEVSPETIDIVRRIEFMAAGAGLASVLQTGLKLGLPDVFDEGSITLDELAKTVKAEPATLGRLMRALVAQGVFEEPEPDKFVHNATSRFLREDSPMPIKYLVLWMGAPWTWAAWPRLIDSVRTGGPVVPDIFGKDFYTYLAEEGSESAIYFTKAMTAITMLSAGPIVDCFDMTGVASVADIAGGEGRLLVEFLERNPGITGVLFDLPSVVATAEPALREGGALADRATVIGGDMHIEIPVDVDLYVLKNVLDAPDANCELGLANIKKTAKPGARIVIVDSLLNADPDEAQVVSLIDLFLLLNVGGGRQTKRNLEILFQKAGLDFVGLKAVPGTFPTQYLAEARVPAE